LSIISFDQLGQNAGLKKIEMIRLAKEVRFIRGDSVDHIDHFSPGALLGEYVIDLFFIRFKAMQAQSLLKAAFQHYAFSIGHPYAKFPLNERRQPTEIPLIQGGKRGNGACRL